MSPLASLDVKITHPHPNVLQKSWCYARVLIKKATETWLLEKMIPRVWVSYIVNLKINVRYHSQVNLLAQEF